MVTSSRDDPSSLAPGDPEPVDLLKQQGEALARRLLHRVKDRAITWTTRGLIGLLASAVIAATLDLVSLPLIAGIVSAAVLIAAALYALAARRLMYLERRRRSWLEIRLKRERQGRLQAENEVDEATVALATNDYQAVSRRSASRGLVRAVMSLKRNASEQRGESRSVSPRAKQRGEARQQSIDTKAIVRRIENRSLELAELEAEIQRLAVPDDRKAMRKAAETREERRAAERAALAADREARERRRQGRTATVPQGTEMALELEIGPTGTRDVRRIESKPTPEELAKAHRPKSA